MDHQRIRSKIPVGLPANTPVGHWWYQRMTAVALVPLSVWLIVLLQKALNAPYADTVHWLSSPINAAAILLWVVLVMYHAALGVRVVIEDYVSAIPARRLAIRAANLIFLVLGLAALAAILFIFSTR